MKLWERVIEHRLRAITRVSMNQFGFMPGRSTMEAIFLIRQVMERYREKKKDLHMVFIDLEKAYDKIPRNVMWWALDKHKVPTKYVGLIKDMYNNVVTSVRTNDGNTYYFPINTPIICVNFLKEISHKFWSGLESRRRTSTWFSLTWRRLMTRYQEMLCGGL